MDTDISRAFSKDKTQMAKEHLKKCSMPQMQIKNYSHYGNHCGGSSGVWE